MNFFNILKKSAAAVLLSMLFASVASAEFYEVPKWLEEYGQKTYSAARADFGRSFNGYCGTYVRCQLTATGIFNGKKDFAGNGNTWYRGFENIETTSGGYTVYRESGENCLEKLSEKYGNDLRNIVVSFPIQANYSAAYPGAGHAVFLHALIDGIAYYSESFSFGNFREGQMMAEDIQSFMARYARRHGGASGCVYFSASDMSDKYSSGVTDIQSEIALQILEPLSFIELQESMMILLAAAK